MDEIIGFEEFVWHSNLIEQVWEAEDEQRIRKQIKRGWYNTSPDPDVLGHFSGWTAINGNKCPEPWDVQTLHRMMFENCRLDNDCIPGQLRTINVYGAGWTGPDWRDVPDLLYRWSAMEADPWDRHYEFEHIHPFADGNGRIGRMLLAAEIGLEAATVRYEDRFDYYDRITAYRRKRK